ncbi:MAG: UDP-N-acetylglucosamine 1-carboxyvinyltransferase [Puniceicoccales bacterium]|nr:UDP-N-acetylglucosamine 1-carboxyvinyltransferase [Puniceicoccales bacterium]
MTFPAHSEDGIVQEVKIVGQHPLRGVVSIGGSKNAGLIILAACALTEETILLHNVPKLDDIRLMLTLLRKLGGIVEWCGDALQISMKRVCGDVDHDAVRRMRASICLLGSLVARKKEVLIALPGGCVFGPRPIDIHLRGLEKLGCTMSFCDDLIHVRAKELRGATIDLLGPNGSTVTGTANILCAATLAKGTTILQNAAREPEVVDLCKFLQLMGAKIEGIGQSTIIVEGVEELHGAEYALMADRIQIGTFALLAAMADSDVKISPGCRASGASLWSAMEEMGAAVAWEGDDVRIRGSAGSLHAIHLETLPYPGFPTDLQAPMTAALTQANGEGSIAETIYQNRFAHVKHLAQMRADLQLDGNRVIVRGPTELFAASVVASDLRCGASLYMAALVARGESTIRGIHHVDRGYECFEKKLQLLGARIERQRE